MSDDLTISLMTREQLEEIASRLPRTVDGMPCTMDDEVYIVHDGLVWKARVDYGLVSGMGGWHCWIASVDKMHGPRNVLLNSAYASFDKALKAAKDRGSTNQRSRP